MKFRCLLVLFLVFESLAGGYALAQDCKAPPGLAVAIWGERHESIHSALLLKIMLVGAKHGLLRGFHEALPVSANGDDTLKRRYFEAEGFKPTKEQLENIYGIDSDAHKLMLTAGMSYLYFRREALAPSGSNADLFINLSSAILQPAMLNLVRSSPELVKYQFIFRYNEMYYVTLAIALLSREYHSLFLEFLKRLHKVARSEAERLNYPIGEVDMDIEGIPRLESHEEDVIAYMHNTISVRDGIIARSIADILCASSSSVPAHVTIGAGHLTGVTEELRKLVPQARIETKDLRHEK